MQLMAGSKVERIAGFLKDLVCVLGVYLFCFRFGMSRVNICLDFRP